MRMAGTTGRAPDCIAKASGIPIHARHTWVRAAREPAPLLRAGITLERGPGPSPLPIFVAPQPGFVVPPRDLRVRPARRASAGDFHLLRGNVPARARAASYNPVALMPAAARSRRAEVVCAAVGFHLHQDTYGQRATRGGS